ncbi:flavin monoamine oxidase family protein [Acinetobacter nectaris]|uniref:flavin monoamine oxidase family protein n=1 Tax=Acinetobacter nectaris TaxID=1219382 RepID=UPI001F1BCE8F|nr:NAD(P)/FAD-dependent oxidoreductase [Acinetobacter nectaris]MCF9034316.1 FAD-dependent oxidoreductase [Acinetobacter nectaris]
MTLKQENGILPIIIIGAGVAGLSCARQLQAHHQHVVILEARERIGGRVHSKMIADRVFDLGASWIHGIEGNPIWDIVKKEGIETEIFNYDVSTFLHDGGQPFSIQEKDQFLSYILEIEKALASHQDCSALDVVSSTINILDIKNYALKMKLQSFFERVANDPFATDLSTLVANYQHYEGYFFGDEVIFPSGYEQVVHSIAKNLDIQLNVNVKEIIQAKDHIIVIDAEGQKFLASKVVVTVPLGVLKAKKITFTPELPSTHQHAIDNMGYGSFNKVFFKLDEPLDFIAKNNTSMNSYFFWHDDYCFNLLDLSEIYKTPTYLMLFGGQQSIFIDRSNDLEVWSFISQHLKAYTMSLPAIPKQSVITRWGADIYSYGSFSFPALHHTEELVLRLNRNVDERIFLSGEHCSIQYAGTVHGAYLHGKDVANQILQMVKN